MNYDEMARRMALVARRIFSGLPELADKGTEDCIREFIAQLKELFPIPKDLEAAISQAFVDTDIRMGEVGYVEDVSGRITEAVAPFCQKPEESPDED